MTAKESDGPTSTKILASPESFVERARHHAPNPLPPNIGLQRTSACGLAAEAGSFGRLSLVTAMCCVLVACTTLPKSAPGQASELEIIGAALQDGWLGAPDLKRPSSHLLRNTRSAWLTEPDSTAFWHRGTVGKSDDVGIEVPSVLLTKLSLANKRSISLKPLQQTTYALAHSMDATPDGKIIVSRPGTSEDGASAVVALMFSPTAGCCKNGYTAYLERDHSQWRVIGYGNIWVE